LKEDHIDPTCNITQVVGTCNFGTDPCACVNYTWSVDMEIGDEGLGLEKIEILNGTAPYQFSHDKFTVGQNISMGVINAKIGYYISFLYIVSKLLYTNHNYGIYINVFSFEERLYMQKSVQRVHYNTIKELFIC